MADSDGETKTPPSWKDLPTEARHPKSVNLDSLSAESIVSLLLEEDREGITIALRLRREIADAAERVAETLELGGDVVLVGAGTSGRLGVLEAAECPPTFGTDPGRIRAVIAGGDGAVFRAQEGAEDDESSGRKAVESLEAGDLVIGLSASSVTRYVRAALGEARGLGVWTILITCADSTTLGAIGQTADLVLALGTGPEILTGSTRLKAASATKAVLNAITTAAMVRLGKVFENLMVDLRPGSAKLEDRALRIIQIAGDVSADKAAELYESSGREVKTAIVMARCGLSPDQTREKLRAASGHVRKALVVKNES